MLTDAQNRGRDQIAQFIALQQMQQMMPPATAPSQPAPGNPQMMSPPTAAENQLVLGNPNYQGHSPASSFDFASGGMFDPGASPTMQGGEPTPTGRDFGSTPAQDWGGAFDPSGFGPNPDPTMSAPDMTASPNAVGTFDTGRGGMPSAPSFENAPTAPGEQSLTDPGFSSGFNAGFNSAVASMGEGMGGMGGSSGDGMGGGGMGGGAVGGMDTSGSGSSESGSSGVG